jgi:hypothetical protein
MAFLGEGPVRPSQRNAVKPMADLGRSLRIAVAQGEAGLGAGSSDEQLDSRDVGKVGARLTPGEHLRQFLAGDECQGCRANLIVVIESFLDVQDGAIEIAEEGRGHTCVQKARAKSDHGSRSKAHVPVRHGIEPCGELSYDIANLQANPACRRFARWSDSM